MNYFVVQKNFYQFLSLEMNRNLQDIKNTAASYKNLASSGKIKHQNELTRRTYLHELPLKEYHLDKTHKEQQYKRYHSSSRNVSRELKLNLSKSKKDSKINEPCSDRRVIRNKENSITKLDLNSLRYSKFSKNKLYSSSSSKLEKLGDKSTAISTLLSSHHQRQQKLKEDRRKHEQGKNCKVIVIDGSEEVEHYIEVVNLGDILNYLKKEYPKTVYYRAVPVQITLDYLLTQSNLSGQFLNGQSLYLKAAYKERSIDQKQSLTLDNFQIIKMIGSGGFSKVYLCRFKKDGNFYAMKVIDKQVIVKNKKKNIIMNERNIMKSSTHPFLIDMKFSFETQKFLIFVVEYCPGGQLFGLIKKYKRLTEDVSRFYIIEIFLGLSYLHQNNVVYRDIKPQNILLGQDGHVKIADLGLAKPDMYEGELAYSFCGSPEYMSPEMILQVGHTYPVDFYCMGALLYELLIGLPPYYSRDTNEIYEAVLSEELEFPSEVPLTTQCKSLLRSLLCKDSKQRLGSIHGVKEILAHPWFGKNSYKSFLEKKISPPITFDSVGRIDLDRHDEKHRKELQQIHRAQKSDSLKFKRQMKQFYFDCRGVTEDRSSRNASVDRKQKSLVRSSSTQRYNTTIVRNYNNIRSNYRKSSEKEMNKTLNSLNSSRR